MDKQIKQVKPKISWHHYSYINNQAPKCFSEIGDELEIQIIPIQHETHKVPLRLNSICALCWVS